jgi:hypothetical protein
VKVLGLRGPAGSPVEEDRRGFQEQIGVLVEGAVIGVRIENELRIRQLLLQDIRVHGNYPVDIPSSGGSIVNDRPAQRATEWGITQTMIDAGTAAYYASDSRFDSDEDIVVRIFREMEVVRLGAGAISDLE